MNKLLKSTKSETVLKKEILKWLGHKTSNPICFQKYNVINQRQIIYIF